MRLMFFLLLFASLTCSPLLAQEDVSTRPRFDVNFSMGFPTGDYAESTHDVGLGMDLGFYFPVFKSAPWLQLGGQFMYLGTGSHDQTIRQDLEISIGNQVIDVLELPMRIEAENSIIGGHLVFRGEIGRTGTAFQPYIQVLGGFRRIATDITVYENSRRGWFDTEDEEITSSTALEDWIFSYGGGLGFHIRIGPKTNLNLNANYLIGGEAEYYTEDDIDRFEVYFRGDGSNYDPSNPRLNGDDIELSADPSTSTTTMLQLNIGLNILLGN